MTHLRQPHVWLPVALLLLAMLGSMALLTDTCVELSVRERVAHGALPAWQASFDALSAACGVGLHTFDVRGEYTPVGRWLLAAVGFCGAVCFLVASRQLLERSAHQQQLPRLRTILAVFVATQIIACLLLLVAANYETTTVGDVLWHGVSTFASLGFSPPDELAAPIWATTTVSLLAALGWGVWLLPLASWRRMLNERLLLMVVAGYVAFLLTASALIALFEKPPGVPRHVTQERPVRAAAFPERLVDAAAQVICASGSGNSVSRETSPLSEGTRLVLAAVVAVGGLGGAVTGGVKMPMLLIAIGIAGRNSDHPRSHPEKRIQTHSGKSLALRILAAFVGLILLATVGVLLLDTLTGSPFDRPATLGEAVLESASAVGGAGLSAGLTSRFASARLSSGIRQSVDSYQYGMAWLMAMMLIGRWLPILLIARGLRRSPTPALPAAPPAF